MKKQILFLVFSFILKFSVGQIVCVQCFDQNDSIGTAMTNLILNGSFENTNCIPINGNANSFCPNSSFYNCNITNWICTGGGPNTHAQIFNSSYCKIPKGNKAASFGNNLSFLCSTTFNDTSCLINNLDCTVTGIPVNYPSNYVSSGGNSGVNLKQTISNLVVGNTYILEFWAGGPTQNGAYTSKGLFAVDVGFGKTFLQCKPTDTLTGIGTRYIIAFKPSSLVDTIKFTSWGRICSTCTELVLDDVKLYTPVPTTPPCLEGITELTETPITIYPNPATSELTINTGNNQASEIIIYDVLGCEILRSALKDKTTTLNIETLAKGVYMYEVRSFDKLRMTGVVKGKVVKE